MKQYTLKEAQKKYKGRYIKVIKTYDYQKSINLYEVIKTYKEIHEDTTLAEDLETPFEYSR